MMNNPVDSKETNITVFAAPNMVGCGGMVHGFFGRTGGVSAAPFHTLNCGFKKGVADRQEVLENRARAIQTLSGNKSTPMVGMHQVHGNVCHHVSAVPDQTLQGDALVTSTRGLMLSIITADCVPVLFCDPQMKVIGAAHAGWRGAVGGILGSTLEAMEKLGAKKSDVLACLGPCIHQPSYEVGEDVFDQAVEASAAATKYFKAGDEPKKWLFDLPGFVKHQLKGAGIAEKNVDDVMVDTYTNPSTFFSCRRSFHDKAPNFGVQISMIGLFEKTIA